MLGGTLEQNHIQVINTNRPTSTKGDSIDFAVTTPEVIISSISIFPNPQRSFASLIYPILSWGDFLSVLPLRD